MLTVEVHLAFPELEIDGADLQAIPDHFQHMVSDEHGRPRCRFRLEATWDDEGSHEGLIDQQYFAVRATSEAATGEEKFKLSVADRAQIRMVYVPAVRDGASQMTDFLRSRLWRAMRWSQGLRDSLEQAGGDLNRAFLSEPGVKWMADATVARWRDLHSGGTYSTPTLASVDLRFNEFVQGVQMLFHPDEAGGDRGLDELSDGQRSLFHLSIFTGLPGK
jgi:hypothetical protein